MKIGYARVSSLSQSTDRQVEALKAYGIEKIYQDKASGKDFERKEYQALLKALRKEDTLVIVSLDRLGRNWIETRDEFKRLGAMGVYINVLDMPMLNTDQVIEGNLTMSFINDLVLSVLTYVAEQERQNNKERQKQGIKVAKAKGVRFGRPNIDKEKIDLANHFIAQGYSITKACAKANLNRKSYYNHLKQLV
jgi:DNA invertase Pin-like site-specific DNA recombinase